MRMIPGDPASVNTAPSIALTLTLTHGYIAITLASNRIGQERLVGLASVGSAVICRDMIDTGAGYNLYTEIA